MAAYRKDPVMEEYRAQLETLYLYCSDITKVEKSRKGLA